MTSRIRTWVPWFKDQWANHWVNARLVIGTRAAPFCMSTATILWRIQATHAPQNKLFCGACVAWMRHRIVAVDIHTRAELLLQHLAVFRPRPSSREQAPAVANPNPTGEEEEERRPRHRRGGGGAPPTRVRRRRGGGAPPTRVRVHRRRGGEGAPPPRARPPAERRRSAAHPRPPVRTPPSLSSSLPLLLPPIRVSPPRPPRSLV